MIKATLFTGAGAIGLAVLASGCATQENKNEPINCTTAESDIRALQSEKGADTKALGVKDENQMISDKIAQIKHACPSS